MITEDYVSFEIAKLLKERGFNKDTYTMSMYDENGEAKDVLLLKVGEEPVLRPTLQMAMKWLREVHNLEIYPYHNNPTIYNSKWWIEIIEYPNSVSEYESGKDEEFDTYEEACEAGIKYCLENLI